MVISIKYRTFLSSSPPGWVKHRKPKSAGRSHASFRAEGNHKGDTLYYKGKGLILSSKL
jgi:hypothetical protein